MGYASYFENIVERLSDTRANFHSELRKLRTRIEKTDLGTHKHIAIDVDAFKNKLTNFLDDLEKRANGVFQDAVKIFSDERVQMVAKLNKREAQLADARQKRKIALERRDRTRDVNARVIGERDSLAQKCTSLEIQVKELSRENEGLRRKLADLGEWRSATTGVKRPRK